MFSIKINIKHLSFALPLLLLLTNHQLIAATFTVNNNADINDINPGDGICETGVANGVCTLRAAISETNALSGADIINLPEDTFTIQTSPRLQDNNSGSFYISDEVDIIGQNSLTTILDANYLSLVLEVSARGIVNISNVTIQNGKGGISASNSLLQLIISNSTIRNNRAGIGSGLDASPVKSITLDNCIIENNTGNTTTDLESSGGGIFFSTGILTISKSTIRNNTASFGGGIATIGTVFLIDSSVIDNTSTVINTNSGFGGGGIKVGSGSEGYLISINSTISGNKAYTSGAGLLVVKGVATLHNTTITNNVADSDNDSVGYGGGIIAGGSIPEPTIRLYNTLIANNIGGQSAPDCSDISFVIRSQGYNLIGDNSDCNFNAGPGDLIGNAAQPINPLLEALADNGGSTLTHALIAGSPAIDAGNPSGCYDHNGTQISLDQRGVERHIDGGSAGNRCDIGAFEIDFILKATAGQNQSVSPNTLVNLDASLSQSSFGISSYSWLQTHGTTIALSDTNSATPHFIAPSTTGLITLQLTVTDNTGNSVTDTVHIDVVDNTATENSSNSTTTGSSGGGLFNGLHLLLFITVLLVARRRVTPK